MTRTGDEITFRARLLTAGVWALAGLALALAAAPPVRAHLCGGTLTPSEAIVSGAVVFVGTVESLENADRWALVHVEEVWNRGELPEWVQVWGTLDEPAEWDWLFGTFANVGDGSRSFSHSQRYLFAPTRVDGHLLDSDCSATTPWTSSLESFRPPYAHEPSPMARPLNLPWWALVIIGIVAFNVVIVIALVLGTALKSGRPATPPPGPGGSGTSPRTGP